MSEESEPRPNTRGKGKRTNSAANGRKKADEAAAKVPPSKKSKANNGGAINGGSYDEEVSDPEDDTMKDEDGPKGKMTDEEKRKNFLERNRYVRFAGIPPIPILC
jgi:ATF/CREB family transcription factor